MECTENRFRNVEKERKSVGVEGNENNNSKVEEKVKMKTYFAPRACDDSEDETPPKDQDECEEWKKRKEDKQKQINEDLHSYNGIFYRACFKSSRDINIVRVNFLGPKAGKSGDFTVKLRIERTKKVSLKWWWYILRFLIGQSDKEFETEELLDTYTERLYGVRGEFRVTLPYPVKIEANKWTDILFELDGPKTIRLPHKRVHRYTRWFSGSEEDKIIINFLYGPRQLSGFHFTLADNPM